MGGGGTYLYAETCFEVAIMSVSTSVRKTKSELLFLLESGVEQGAGFRRLW